jgi:precorrin-6B methylase 2
MPAKEWTPEEIEQLGRSYHAVCILMAAAELDLFGLMAGSHFTATQAAEKIQGDLRATTILLDALAALRLLDKAGDQYAVPASLANLLVHGRPGSLLEMIHHQAVCLRQWTRLAATVKAGHAFPRVPSIRGAEADYASFIEAMDNISRPIAGPIVGDLMPLNFQHVLDVGGGSGSWTIAFLRANPAARATLFDLPQVMAQARARLTDAGLIDRVTLAPGDFYQDALPAGADLAWISAIVHQNSRAQNRDLFTRVFAALVSDGQVLIRDFLMESSRIAPVGGAMFAVNMLVNTDQGNSYSFDELSEDLAAAGFRDARIVRPDNTMHAVMAAKKP